MIYTLLALCLIAWLISIIYANFSRKMLATTILAIVFLAASASFLTLITLLF